MGLSKDNTDVIEEIKILELTTAQKRRLRRKKLKAAKAGSTDSNNITQKDLLGLNLQSNKSVVDCPEHAVNKKHKGKCDTQILNITQCSVSKDTTNINDQTPEEKIPNSSFDQKAEPKHTVVNKKKPKDPKYILKGDDLHLKINEKILPQLETSFTTGDIKANSEEVILNKTKANGNHELKHENHCSLDNKKNKFDNSLVIDNQTAENLNVIEGQSVTCPQSDFFVRNQSPKLTDLSEIKTHTPRDTDQVLSEDKIVESLKLETLRTKLQNKTLENPEHTPQNTVSIENIIGNLDKQNMGKIQDTTEKKEELNKIELKKEGSTSSDPSAKTREDIKAAREAKKLAKQKAKKKNDAETEDITVKSVLLKIDEDEDVISDTNIVKVQEVDKRKAELRAERRAKQEAQRAAKQESQHAAKQTVKEKTAKPESKEKEPVKSKEEKSPKDKLTEKSKIKTQSTQKLGWFQHLYVEKDKESLSNIPINSNMHPAVVKLGVQLATRVVTGSNARCIALLDAIKKMVRDYSLPARTEFGRGLQAQLAAAASFLWVRRAPTAAETNALKHFRRQLTQLPANVDEFDAKKQLQEEIDRYIREQIDMAGEAISLILRNKISPGDHILTYGCSSLIVRVLSSAWEAGVRFRATVAGARGQRGPEMLRRLRARGVPASYVDISALSYVMSDVQKVLVGAGALLAHGAALGAAGSAQVALVARARNVPVLVACETHKFSERTHVDPLACHEIGDPDDLIDKTDENSPLKDWRSNPNLTLLNVTYDVTPPSLITAVVTELGILPCTSAPVVLRFKQSEYGM